MNDAEEMEVGHLVDLEFENSYGNSGDEYAAAGLHDDYRVAVLNVEVSMGYLVVPLGSSHDNNPDDVLLGEKINLHGLHRNVNTFYFVTHHHIVHVPHSLLHYMRVARMELGILEAIF